MKHAAGGAFESTSRQGWLGALVTTQITTFPWGWGYPLYLDLGRFVQSNYGIPLTHRMRETCKIEFIELANTLCSIPQSMSAVAVVLLVIPLLCVSQLARHLVQRPAM